MNMDLIPFKFLFLLELKYSLLKFKIKFGYLKFAENVFKVSISNLKLFCRFPVDCCFKIPERFRISFLNLKGKKRFTFDSTKCLIVFL